MEYPNFHQLYLILTNQPSTLISKYVSKDFFIFMFLTHLQSHFSDLNKTLNILEPLLDPELTDEQSTTIAIDDTEVGDINLIHNSFFDVSSLVYSPPYSSIETKIFDYEHFEDLTITDYFMLLNEFAAILFGEHIFYEAIIKKQL